MTTTRAKLDAVLAASRIIPVLTIEHVEDAVPLARALIAGGVTVLEVTLRTAAGLESAVAIMAAVPDAIVGIGTVLTPGDLARAEAIGAKFALSPGATPALLEAAAQSAMPFMPGIATASELMQAMQHGFDTVKFFPANTMGGQPALRGLGGPFPTARFCPTGGVSDENSASWLALPNVVAVGGSWLTPAGEMRARDWAAITRRTAAAVAAAAKAMP
jgi:2-dehydro-3-deoxyphosphogluconate aldolase/(4S)-4-hydroxy-2-oxoglutarate aldolase